MPSIVISKAPTIIYRIEDESDSPTATDSTEHEPACTETIHLGPSERCESQATKCEVLAIPRENAGVLALRAIDSIHMGLSLYR